MLCCLRKKSGSGLAVRLVASLLAPEKKATGVRKDLPSCPTVLKLRQPPIGESVVVKPAC
jgi:hypothetical protein